MSSNNNNLKSAWSRQMRILRERVERIDLTLLELLQQRTKLSEQIGRMKRRQGAVVYVPERERELVARLIQLSKGRPVAAAVTALYREVFSISRAAQGQAPIGVLQASASFALPAARAFFGACDQLMTKGKWAELSDSLDSGALSLALLTGSELIRALQPVHRRSRFLDRLTVVGDFTAAFDTQVPLAERIFIVTPHAERSAPESNRILILIECNSTANAIKSLLHAMPDLPFQAEPFLRPSATFRQKSVVTLARLILKHPVEKLRVASCLRAACEATGVSAEILGIYAGTEDYAG